MIDRVKPTYSSRIQYIDNLRVFACFLVLLMHAPLYRSAEFEENSFYTIYLLIATVSSKLFFMLSGALLLPLKRPAKNFINHRLKVVLIPLALWSIFYLIEHYFVGGLTWGQVKREFYSALFTPVEEMLWFVYVMAGMYLLMPIISKCVLALEKRYIKYYLFLWILSSFAPYVTGFFLIPDIQHSTFSSIANFTGYLILGYYLHRWPLPIFTKRLALKSTIIFALFVVVLPIAVYCFQSNYIDHNAIINIISHDLGANTIFTGILFFTIIQHFTPQNCKTSKIGASINNIFRNISVITFGTYLCHMLIFRNILWPLATEYLHLPLLVEAFLLATLCMIISYVVMRLVYLLPFSRYIIGH